MRISAALRRNPATGLPPSGDGATATHCPYCAFQCGMKLSGPPARLKVQGDESFPVNKGALCVKGWNCGETVAAPDRLTSPLIRESRWRESGGREAEGCEPGGAFRPATWEEALERVVSAFKRVQESHGADAAGVFGGGSLTNEKAYLLGKFARVALGTSNIDYNGRFCMSSAAAASIRAFGIDRGLPFPVEDIAHTGTILLVGGNPAETMPPLMQYFEEQRTSGGNLIVADPRRTLTARSATLHLRLEPGTDAALANGLLHVLVRDGLIDEDYIRQRTEGFEQAKAAAAAYWPEQVERITGVSEAHLVQAAHMLGKAESAMVLTGRGPEQQVQGVNNALSFINLALALGLPGRRNSGYGCLTGQGNGQGGREHGQKADQLPGYRRIDDPAARRHVAQVWGVDEASIPGPGKSAYEMLDQLGRDGGVRALLVIGSNVAVSAPNAAHVAERLRALDFLVVADFFLSETAQLADVVLPAAQWLEEDGTMTNLEGRVVRRRRAAVPPDGVATDIELVCKLAEGLGKGEFFRFADTEAIFDELGRASAGGPADYSGITYQNIEAQNGVFWPCPAGREGDASSPEGRAAEGRAGTPRIFTDGFPTANGRAKFHAIRHRTPAEPVDDDFPLRLTTGRVLAQYQSGVQTRRVQKLNDMAPEPFLELHPSTAARYGTVEGELVTAVSRRGSASFRVRITGDIRPDTVFAPFHWAGEGSANRLTNPALDPVSRMPEFKICAVRLEPANSAPASSIPLDSTALDSTPLEK